MRTSGVDAAIMRVIGKLEQKNARIEVARMTGFLLYFRIRKT